MAWTHCSGDTDVGNIWVSRFTRENRMWGTPDAIGSRNNDSVPNLVIGANGAVTVVWTASRDIWVRTYQPTLGWGAAERVAVGHTADVGFDRDGGVLVVWIDFQAGYTIGVRKLSGTGWQAPQLVDLGASIEHPSAAIGPNGDTFFVWTRPGGSISTLWAIRYASARGWSPVELIPGGAPIKSFGSDVGVDRDGNGLVVWQRGGPNDTGPIRIWSNRFTAGQGWNEATPLESGLPDQRLLSNSRSASLVVNASGDAMAAWAQTGSGGTVIWANRYLKRTGWEQARQIGDAEANDPSIALDGSGDGMVVWSVLDQYSTSSGLSARRFVASRGWSSGWETAAPPMRVGAWRPVPIELATDGSGGFFLVWTEQTSDLSIWASRFSQTSK